MSTRGMKWLGLGFAALVLTMTMPCEQARAGIGAFGTWWDTKDYDALYGGGAKLGMGLVSGFWVEARGSWLQGDDSFRDITLIPLEALVGWEWDVSDYVKPYVGAGLGYYLKDFDWKNDWDEWKDEFDAKDCVGYFGLLGLNVEAGPVTFFGEAKYNLISEDDSLEWRGSDLDETYSFDGLSVNLGLKLGF